MLGREQLRAPWGGGDDGEERSLRRQPASNGSSGSSAGGDPPSCPRTHCRDVAASYGVGAVGGLIYLRLLNKSIDSVGVGLGGALGQPRLLIPVILALGYNRWAAVICTFCLVSSCLSSFPPSYVSAGLQQVGLGLWSLQLWTFGLHSCPASQQFRQ